MKNYIAVTAALAAGTLIAVAAVAPYVYLIAWSVR
jgi:hypothetical protein